MTDYYLELDDVKDYTFRRRWRDGS
jgi:hypothetical protein